MVNDLTGGVYWLASPTKSEVRTGRGLIALIVIIRHTYFDCIMTMILWLLCLISNEKETVAEQRDKWLTPLSRIFSQDGPKKTA